MKKKGFTLIELLVVISIIAMLLAILMPALGKVKKLAQRLVCGTNLKGMANALNVYAFDYDDEFPVAGGGGNNTWKAETAGWEDPVTDWTVDNDVSVAASLFLLVREADVGVKSFICKGGDQTPFVNETTHDMVELWDFGDSDAANFGTYGPAKCQSYSYQIPYNMVFGSTNFNYPADGTGPPGNAIMADKNPWFDNKMTQGGPTSEEYIGLVAIIGEASGWDGKTDDVPKWNIQVGNAEPHEREGQNVLFGDGHVSFEKRADVGTRYDNIYTVQSGGTPEQARRMGSAKSEIGQGFSANDEDSMLVSDDESKK